MELVPCDGCRRHVDAGAATCPFCGGSVTPGPLRAPVRVRRLTRAAILYLGASLAPVGCGGGGTATDEPPEQEPVVQPYGAPIDDDLVEEAEEPPPPHPRVPDGAEGSEGAEPGAHTGAAGSADEAGERSEAGDAVDGDAAGELAEDGAGASERAADETPEGDGSSGDRRARRQRRTAPIEERDSAPVAAYGGPPDPSPPGL
ncbi:MAG TPA: hypothetical protein RMH99_02435 [Sandaracinaceae bacterium LLY-WYZ-13_1]|nr:hypothetical protein [Sandaracinaceae bacterium LLY-WYZ-13_1]